ncbi:MAG: DinB family protein, partial [Solibacillus sp.]
MLNFFKYNWQVRDEWFDWCSQLSNEELKKERTGGVGSILYTLFHIIDVEYSWLRAIQGKEDIVVE